MGGIPIFALNITCFPTDELPLEVLHQILKGGNDIAKKANIPILGGHSIKDKEPKYGLVVSGLVKKNKLVKNNNAKIGDELILTKPIGTGIISTAIKRGEASKNDIDNVTNIMTDLNQKGANAMNKVEVNACTDITGYGLLGHIKEICEFSDVNAILDFDAIPFIDNVLELAEQGIIPGGSKRNLDCFQSHVKFDDKIKKIEQLMLADAQTSGGLLISVSPENSKKLIEELKKEKCLINKKIGKIVAKEISHLIQVK